MVDDMFYPFAGIVAIIAGLIAIPTTAFVILSLFEGFPRIEPRADRRGSWRSGRLNSSGSSVR